MQPLRAWLPLLLLALSACSGSSSKKGASTVPTAGEVPVFLTSTELTAAGTIGSVDHYVPHIVSEVDEGIDLNYDGDFGDLLLRIYDAETKSVNELGFETDHSLDFGNGFFTFRRSEFKEKIDLNGDGDQDDYVLYAHIFSQERTYSLGFSFTASRVIKDKIFFDIPESLNGGLDFNHDGDTDDTLFFSHDPVVGMSHNMDFDFPGLTFDTWNDRIVFAGPTQLIVYDVAAGTTNYFPIIAYDMRGSGGTVAFSVLEREEGTDLNLDGDKRDSIVLLYDYSANFLRNTRIERIPGSGFAFAEGTVAFTGKLNGQEGIVLIDVATSVPRLVPMSAIRLYGVGRHFLALQSEARQAADLNGDGDAADDVAVFVNADNLSTRSLRLATSSVIVRGEKAFISVPEGGQGDGDLNGDKDIDDGVLFRLDPATGVATNLELSAGVLGVLAERFMILNVFEGKTSLNADDDTDDCVLHVLDLETDRIKNLERAVVGDQRLRVFRYERYFPVLVPEDAEGRTDLNRDFDTVDDVVFLVEIEPETP